jgi:hypothetical protein
MIGVRKVNMEKNKIQLDDGIREGYYASFSHRALNGCNAHEAP